MTKKIRFKDLIPWEVVKADLMKDPEFVKEWKKQEPHYQLARQIIGARLKQKMTQAELAKKAGTGQAAISRLESGNAKPSLSLLQRISRALNTDLHLIIR